MQEKSLKKEKSKVDIFIEKLDKVFIEKGLEPPKLTSKTGSLIIISPKNVKKKRSYPDIVYKQLPTEELPGRLDNFIKRWRNIAIEYKRSFIPPKWNIKCSSIRFVIYGGYYVIYPGNLKVSSELFEYMSREIESDLWDMGAEYVTYTGMID